MSKNTGRFFTGLAACLAAFLVIAFAIPFTKNACFWLSFAFGLAAILIQIYSMPKAMAGKDIRSKFYGFPIFKISLIYLVAQLILSIVFMAVSVWVAAWIPAVIFVILLCAAVIGFVGADAMREEVEHMDVQIKQDVSTMRKLQSKLSTLSSQCSGQKAAKAVADFTEQLRFSDPVSSPATAETEAELSACIDTLQQAVVDGNEEDILTLCRKAGAVLSERNRLCKLNK